MTSSVQEITINLQLEENEPLGARPNEALVITNIQAGTPADGQLRVGDQIRKINQRVVRTLNDFYRIIRIAHPIATLVVLRAGSVQDVPVEIQPAADPRENIPADIGDVLMRRHGYRYKLVKMDREKSKKLGLSIKTRDNRVIVCGVEVNSLSAEHLQVLDHIVFVSRSRVTQSEVAQLLLIKALKEQGSVEFIVGRPTSQEAVQAAQQALRREDDNDPPSVRLNEDVQHIMRQLVNASLSAEQQPTRGILTRPGQPPVGRVTIAAAANHQVFNIASDNVGRVLRQVSAPGTRQSPFQPRN